MFTLITVKKYRIIQLTVHKKLSVKPLTNTRNITDYNLYVLKINY